MPATRACATMRKTVRLEVTSRDPRYVICPRATRFRSSACEFADVAAVVFETGACVSTAEVFAHVHPPAVTPRTRSQAQSKPAVPSASSPFKSSTLRAPLRMAVTHL